MHTWATFNLKNTAWNLFFWRLVLFTFTVFKLFSDALTLIKQAKGSKRYFRCRAAVTVRSLRKLLSAKYALGVEHKIHMFLDGIQLPDHFRLLDIAYISSWKRVSWWNESLCHLKIWLNMNNFV